MTYAPVGGFLRPDFVREKGFSTARQLLLYWLDGKPNVTRLVPHNFSSSPSCPAGASEKEAVIQMAHLYGYRRTRVQF
jgi:hypothetical protein